jgi:hypothetical protein
MAANRLRDRQALALCRRRDLRTIDLLLLGGIRASIPALLGLPGPSFRVLVAGGGDSADGG